ncbi:MAG: hypothetical protein CL912_31210 [Deltaproteobacteria bacterium]|nr:hypothetical protein [Deltaproteobacteria bacterium]
MISTSRACMHPSSSTIRKLQIVHRPRKAQSACIYFTLQAPRFTAGYVRANQRIILTFPWIRSGGLQRGSGTYAEKNNGIYQSSYESVAVRNTINRVAALSRNTFPNSRSEPIDDFD